MKARSATPAVAIHACGPVGASGVQAAAATAPGPTRMLLSKGEQVIPHHDGEPIDGLPVVSTDPFARTWPVVRPARVRYWPASETFIDLKKIRWSRWARTSAVGSGAGRICDQVGCNTPARFRITLTDPWVTPCGRGKRVRVYSRLRIRGGGVDERTYFESPDLGLANCTPDGPLR